MSSERSLPLVSFVIVSFNTRDLLRDCLASLFERTQLSGAEVYVVDNASRDGSADMVAVEFPAVHLIRSSVNLGFAGANNRALPKVEGRYVVLLNSDAFLKAGALEAAIAHMEREPQVGVGGARLVGSDGCWQPSARLLPSPLNLFLTISGLSARFPQSRICGRADRSWADQNVAADVGWVPGAFAIMRRDVLRSIGYFDESFFLYYEEVDLCKRFLAAGYAVRYWPDVEVIHLGGQSSRTVDTVRFTAIGSQLTLWQFRSAFLYYRKHHGRIAWVAKEVERQWHRLRNLKNKCFASNGDKVHDSQSLLHLLEQAWHETSGGKVSPSRPW